MASSNDVDDTNNTIDNHTDKVILQIPSIPPPMDSKTFKLDFLSKTLFMVASILYVVVASIGLANPSRSTKYLMLSLFAAFLFAVVGVLDVIVLPRIMGVIMILAGCFGVLSVAVRDTLASKALNSVSVHLFLLEAVCQFVLARVETGRLKLYLRSGDIFWVLGALTDVILSYMSLRNIYSKAEARAAVFGACLWLSCSLVYISAAVYVRRQTYSSGQDVPMVSDLEMTEEVPADAGNQNEENSEQPAPESKIV